eukprot:CAMPEP_0119403974 /NCGR_PEP_ID=MMETSP1334-20130426/143661_1 /TAXON_ID=127549 /ORGANISM="Calcidiscus leptoporus, Strain RCC1130" /LENGTH=186 /DNA_ID=CAMNT_0007427931 /DNA_START=528 /DNA_END=1089 /DNA_ORIENTATION=+
MTIPTFLGLVHAKTSAVQLRTVHLSYCVLGVSRLLERDEAKPAGVACLAVDRQEYIRNGAKLVKGFAELASRRVRGEAADVALGLLVAAVGTPTTSPTTSSLSLRRGGGEREADRERSDLISFSPGCCAAFHHLCPRGLPVSRSTGKNTSEMAPNLSKALRRTHCPCSRKERIAAEGKTGHGEGEL